VLPNRDESWWPAYPAKGEVPEACGIAPFQGSLPAGGGRVCLKSALKHLALSEARGPDWWVQAPMEDPRTRFLVALLLGLTVLRRCAL